MQVQRMRRPAASSRRGYVRWKRMFAILLLLGLLGAGGYAASWLNARSYFLVVGPVDVRIEKGEMLPFGHEPFIPAEVATRRAYATFPLPAGVNIPRGETKFTDRVELDQAVFRLLKDCLAFSLSRGDKNTASLAQRYIDQLRALPGTSITQQLELEQLERDAAFSTARARVQDAEAMLKDAVGLFRKSARGPGARAGDGELRARQVEAAIQVLGAAMVQQTPEAPVHDSRSTSETSSTSTVVHRGE